MSIIIENLNITAEITSAYETKNVFGHIVYYFHLKSNSETSRLNGCEVAVYDDGKIVGIKFNKNVTVQYKGNTAERSPRCKNCGTWINHWKNFAGDLPKECCVIPCAKENKNNNSLEFQIRTLAGLSNKGAPDRGAHVTHVLGSNDDIEFIIPVCESDNPANTSQIKVKDGTWFVRADQSICE